MTQICDELFANARPDQLMRMARIHKANMDTISKGRKPSARPSRPWWKAEKYHADKRYPSLLVKQQVTRLRAGLIVDPEWKSEKTARRHARIKTELKNWWVGYNRSAREIGEPTVDLKQVVLLVSKELAR